MGDATHAGRGGGVLNNGSLKLDFSTLSANKAADGAGIYNSHVATLDMMRSEVSGNAATRGGGLFNYGVLYASNSTIGGNSVTQDGGGIYNYADSTGNVYNATIAFNEADADFDSDGGGAGIYNYAGATFNLRNSVVAGNAVQVDHAFEDCYGAVSSYGRNKFSDAANANLSGCAITQVGPGDFSLLSSLNELGSLQNNGGSTRTHALVPPSDMIDGAEATVACINQSGPLITDQRAQSRVAFVRCDTAVRNTRIAFSRTVSTAIFDEQFVPSRSQKL